MEENVINGLHLDQLLAAAVFIGARVSGLMVFSPLLGSNAIPAPLKAAFTLVVTSFGLPLARSNAIGTVFVAVGRHCVE